MKKYTLTIIVMFLLIQTGWSQKEMVLPGLKQKVESIKTNLKALECNELDPLSLNATIVWSDDKSQLAILMKANLLPGWHIYAYVPAEQLHNGVEDIRKELNEDLDADPANIHVVSGQPAHSILSWSEENDAGCIVIKSHQPGLADYLLGSTAAKVVRHAKSDVLVLRNSQ